MNGASDAYKSQIVQSHTIRTRVDVLRHGQVVDQLDTVFDGTVTADATAPQVRSIVVNCADPNGTLAQGGVDPFTTKVRPWRGVRVPGTTIVRDLRNDAASWAPGNHVGTVVVGGALTMAP